MELSDLRQQIDQIDSQLLPLFLRRMELAHQVAQCKMENNLPVKNRQREREILDQVQQASGKYAPYAHRLYSTIFELSRAYQDVLCPVADGLRAELETALENAPAMPPETGVVACQGVEGAYGQMAADRLFPRGKLMFFKTFDAVFDAVESGLCQYGVVPIENSSNGSVRSTYELLRTKKVRIVRSTRLCIRHELLAKPGTRLEDITEIRSHAQALGQCSKFLKGLDAKLIPCENTAAAAAAAAQADAGVAAIASHESARLYGLVPVATGIQNSDNNYTRFVCIAGQPIIYPGADHISLILACPHRPGSLYEVLAKLAALEVNLIKLESCPIVGHDFEFMFFLELQANVNDPKIRAMLESIARDCEDFRFLGNYPEV